MVSSATLSATPEVGATLTLDAVVRNAGDGGAAATTLRYYRSDDSAISTSDEEIGTDEVASLGAGESSDYHDGRFYVVDYHRVFVYTGDERRADDHGDTPAAATTVAVPSTTDGELKAGGDKDYFRLEVAEAATLIVRTTGSTDTSGTLFDGGGTSLETDDDGPGTNFRIERDVAAGTYYVEVRGYRSSTTGWYEVEVDVSGGGGFSRPRVISRDADGANSVHAADLDGDGDTDVLSASVSDDTIAWHENLGGGSFSARRVITTVADWARSVFAADLDGDGDTDVLSASEGDDTIGWYEYGSPAAALDLVEESPSASDDRHRGVL